MDRAPPELNAFVNARKEAPIAEESEDAGHDEDGGDNGGMLTEEKTMGVTRTACTATPPACPCKTTLGPGTRPACRRPRPNHSTPTRPCGRSRRPSS